MKILQLVTRRQFRGAEVSAANLSSGLLTAGHQVVFVGLFDPPGSSLSVEGATNRDLNGNTGLLDLSLLIRLVKLIREEKPDVLQANGSDTLKYLVLASCFTKLGPIVYRNISLISTWMGKRGIKRALYQQLFRFVDFVASVGNESREDFIRTMEFPERKIKVIRRGIPQLKTSQGKEVIRKSSKTSDSAFVLIHIGNFSPEKNQLFLIEVMDVLVRHSASFILWFVGEGVMQQQVEGRVTLRKLNEHIRFLGLRNDIGDLLHAADVNVLCSTVEGVPGVVLEAGMAGIPTVAINVGGTGEVVKSESGILLQRHDPEAFANAILDLSRSNEKCIQLGHGARKLAEAEFSLEASTAEFIHLYAGLIKHTD